MKAILVCVQYDDILALTLPLNKKHFETMLVVTSNADVATQRLCVEHGVECLMTDVFYAQGAMFNKGAAMEEGFEAINRMDPDWIAVLDADIIWPRMIDWSFLRIGELYTPQRYLLDDISLFDPRIHHDNDLSFLHMRGDVEWAGYTQVFHTSDPVLDARPWYGIDWSHCGGCDSVFQQRWPKEKKKRPSFKVLHLGPTDTNWCGRTSKRLDGQTYDAKRETDMHRVMHSYRMPGLGR